MLIELCRPWHGVPELRVHRARTLEYAATSVAVGSLSPSMIATWYVPDVAPDCAIRAKGALRRVSKAEAIALVVWTMHTGKSRQLSGPTITPIHGSHHKENIK